MSFDSRIRRERMRREQPNTIIRRRARDRATHARFSFAKKPGTVVRTKERRMTSLSSPWNSSTVQMRTRPATVRSVGRRCRSASSFIVNSWPVYGTRMVIDTSSPFIRRKCLAAATTSAASFGLC
jgi:hypothetical protein